MTEDNRNGWGSYMKSMHADNMKDTDLRSRVFICRHCHAAKTQQLIFTLRDDELHKHLTVIVICMFMLSWVNHINWGQCKDQLWAYQSKHSHCQTLVCW